MTSATKFCSCLEICSQLYTIYNQYKFHLHNAIFQNPSTLHFLRLQHSSSQQFLESKVTSATESQIFDIVAWKNKH